MVDFSVRQGLTPSEPKTTSSDFAFADRYLQDRRFPKWELMRPNFPFIPNRRAANIDFPSEEWRRTYRGVVPFDYYAYDQLKIIRPRNWMSTKYIFVNKVPIGNHIPQGYYGTSSGISPIDFMPFTVGSTSDNPTVISGILADQDHQYSEFIIAKNTAFSGWTYYPKFIESYDHSIGKFEWKIKPSYQAPIWPQQRFPNGAVRYKYFK
jgi:hypothetical protein